MAKTPENALKLLTDTVPAATAKAQGEIVEMQKVIDAQGGGFKLAASDWDFYAEQVRKAQYDLDQSQIRPYFELDTVLQDGSSEEPRVGKGGVSTRSSRWVPYH